MTATALRVRPADRADLSGRATAPPETPVPPQRTKKVVVVGQGPAGVHLALRAVRAGYLVIGLDRDARRIDGLGRGRPGLPGVDDAAVATALHTRRYVPTGNSRFARGFDIAVIPVPDGAPFSQRAAARSAAVLAPYLRPGATVIVEAPRGSQVDLPALAAGLEAAGGVPAGRGVAVAVSSERGPAARRSPSRSGSDRLVEGLDVRSTTAAAVFYRELARSGSPVREPDTAPFAALAPPPIVPAPRRPCGTERVAALAPPPIVPAPRRPRGTERVVPEVLHRRRSARPAPPVTEPATGPFATLAPPPVVPAPREPSGTEEVTPGAVSTVTVIVPAHNEEQGIASTIEGLLNQRTPEWLRITDVVVVVNNSTDRTADIARRYPVRVLEMPENPHKKSGAMNHGWRHHGQDSEFVLTMDADTVVLPDTIEKMTAELVDDPGLGAVCARYWAKSGRGLVRRLQRLEYARYDDLRELRGWRVNVASGAAAMYRQVALQEVVELRGRPEPWDNESLIEDYALTLDLKTRGWRVGAAPGAHVLTEPPATFRELWRQRLRWGRGGMDECLKRGWTRATRRDILSYSLFSLSVFFRFLWITMMVLMAVQQVPLRYALIGLVPVVVMWAERVTSAWRLRDKTVGDMVLVAALLVEDLYGFFLELCAVTAALMCLGARRQAW